MSIKIGVQALLIAGLLVAWSGDAKAFQGAIKTAVPYRNGNVKGEQVTGTYALAANERLSGVYIIAINAQGGVTSMAQGVVFPNGTWTAALGDFQLASYQIRYIVQYGPNRITYNYFSPTYPWGKGP